MSHEYNNMSSNGSCAYNTLGNYSLNNSLNGVPFQGKVTSGIMVVPEWGSIGYNDLCMGKDSQSFCGNYPDVGSAYGKGAGSCQTVYKTTLCGSTQAQPQMAQPQMAQPQMAQPQMAQQVPVRR